MVYIPKYFKLHELFPKSMMGIPEKFLWIHFDPRILHAADLLREEFGKTIVNNWKSGGPWQYCGFRPWNCSEGALYSQHKFGRALDLHFENATAEEVRRSIINKRGTYSMITCIEMDISWVHIDCRNYDGLLFVYPQKEKP